MCFSSFLPCPPVRDNLTIVYLDSGVKIKKKDRTVLLKEIGEGADLKKTETVDKSAPKTDGVKIKKIDRKGLLDGIEADDKKLKHVKVSIE